MSANYSFVGEVNRNNAMGAVADTMNELNLDILKATMEMGGKQVVEKDGKAYALQRLDDSEVKDLKDEAGTNYTFKLSDTVSVTCTKDSNGDYYGSTSSSTTPPVVTEYQFKATTSTAGVTTYEGKSALKPTTGSVNWEATTGLTTVTVPANPTVSYPDTTIGADKKDTAMAIFDILGINPSSDIDGGIDGMNWKISLSSNGDSVTMKVAFIDKNTGDTMIMGVKLGDDGSCKGLSALANKGPLDINSALGDKDLVITDVDGGGLLESWGISNPEELQPGDLFLVQQKLQIIKDTVSAVHTTGKTQGDIMREATQKFAQG
jgi:hypothetical protein